MTIYLSHDERIPFVAKALPVTVSVIVLEKQEKTLMKDAAEVFGVELTELDHSKWAVIEGARWDYSAGDRPDETIFYFRNEHDDCLFKLLL